MYATSKLRWRLSTALAGLFVFSFALSPVTQAKEVDRDSRTTATPAKSAGDCDLGAADAVLDGNNVRALLFNNGSLFWKRGGDHIYEVPKGSGRQAIFASGLWLAGQIDGTDRFAGSDYGPYEYWPGPLDENGNVAPDVCSQFDRFWKVDAMDVTNFNDDDPDTMFSPDLETWPIGAGAPFYIDIDGNGRRTLSIDDVSDSDPGPDGIYNEAIIEYTLGDAEYGNATINLLGDNGVKDVNVDVSTGARGDDQRPAIIGDQGLWWVMNDKGGSHDWSELTAIGVEVQALAFSFRSAGALNNTTFYQYQIFYRGAAALQNAYVGIWSDPDLGFFSDDYVGSNPESGIGFVYNGDSFDEGSAGYGDVPPALGYDFFQGPLVDNDGIDNNGNGVEDEPGERIAMEKFVYYNNDSSVQGNPSGGQEAYQYLRGEWRDGSPITFGGVGYQTGEETNFMFPANPPAFWSEYNIDGLGTSNTPADRRFLMSAGPFIIQPGDFQEIVFGLVWSQAQGTQSAQPQIASVRQMFFDDITAQALYNANFNIPPPPPEVVVEATPLDQAVVLEWTSATGSIEDLFQYEEFSAFAEAGAPDSTYNFEGFKVFQYRSLSDQIGTLVKTFDVRNNVTSITDVALDTNTGEIVTEVVALGEDNGNNSRTETSITILNDAFTSEPLRNNTTYYFGVQPYAYNAFSSPQKVYAAPVTRVEVRPSIVDARDGGTVINSDVDQGIPVVLGEGNGGQGTIQARVVNPAAVTGDTYRVEFYSQTIDGGRDGEDNDGDGDIDEADERGVEVEVTNYDVINETTGAVLFDGRAYAERTGKPAPQTTNIVRADGLLFDVQGPPARIDGFLTTHNADGLIADQGPLFRDTGAAPTYRDYPAPEDPYSLPFIIEAEVEDHQPQQITRITDTQIGWFLGPDPIFTSLYGNERTVNLAYGDFFVDLMNLDFGVIKSFDYELRFTEGGGQGWVFLGPSAVNPGGTALQAELIDVPFEMWRVGPAAGEADDVRLLPGIFDYDGNSTFNLVTEASIDATNYAREGTDADSGLSSRGDDPYSDGFFFIIPQGDDEGLTGQAFYDAQLARANSAGSDLTSAMLSQTAFGSSSGPFRNALALTAWNAGDVTVPGAYPTDQFPEVGTRMRIQTTKPNQPGDTFTFNTAEFAAQRGDLATAESALDLIAITPNPYRGVAEYETASSENIARFVNLPPQATIRIFTMSGTLVRTLVKTNPSMTTIDWDLRTEAALPVASGIYLIHVEARDSGGTVIGERVLKFGVVQRRVQLDVL